MTASKKKITDIYKKQVVTRKEQNKDGEWELVEKVINKKRPVEGTFLVHRFLHYFLDITIIQIPLILFTILGQSIIQGILVYFAVYFVYYITFEFYFQRTIGKYATGSLVVNEYGERPDLKTICLRTLTRIVPFEPFSIFWTEDNRFWHDTWTKTFVIFESELSLIRRIQADEKPKISDLGQWDEWRNWQQ